MMELSEIHDCEKCQGKIVGIELDKLGNTYCGYCHKKVNYKPYFMEYLKSEEAYESLKKILTEDEFEKIKKGL